MGIIENLEKMQKGKFNQAIIKINQALIKFLIKFGSILISYSFLVWIFFSIYDRAGFEKTLIILLVGVINYGIRRN